MTTPTIQEILDLPLPGEPAGAETVREYLADLLAALWRGTADPKYGMTGESDWRYDLYDALRDAGHVPAWRDGYGIGHRADGRDHPEDRARADELIGAAILALGVRQYPPAPRTDERTAALARILTDLDRCPHGRHRIDSCLSCPGGQSLGNPHMRPGAVVGYDLGGEPYTAPWSDRPDPLCSTSEPDAWRPRPDAGEGRPA